MRRFFLTPLVAVVVALMPVTAHAEPDTDPSATPTIALDQSSWTGLIGTDTTVTGTVENASATAAVRLSRLDGADWQPTDAAITSSGTTFSTTAPTTADPQTVRAELVDGDQVVATSDPATVAGRKALSALTLTMAAKAADYKTVPVSVAWTTEDGRRPSGTAHLLFRAKGEKRYEAYKDLALVDGVGQTVITPRNDGTFEVRTEATAALEASVSNTRAFDNRPPGKVVTLPRGSAKPKITLPAQSRHSRASADPKISKISDAVWDDMTGRSWHRGCPVGRSKLRVVRVSYWAFDGYVRRGEIVVAAKHAKATSKVFTRLFAQKVPIRSMYRVDRFGWNKKLKGADDYKSMRADNTSGFNCRGVVGAPNRRSPHAYGKAVDINPWENPYASPQGWTPNGSWQKRKSPASITWRGRNDPVVKTFKSNGFRWLGGFDLHHFER